MDKHWEEQRQAQLINIINKEGQLRVSSREVADNFGKQHKDVLESIRNLVADMGVAEKSADLFIESKYQHPQNKQWYKEYEMTRDGFTLLAMGFTGKKALEWKLKYIEAFNKMEQMLKEQKLLSPTEILKVQLQAMEEQDKKITRVEDRMDKFENESPLFTVECSELQALVKKVGLRILGGKNSAAYKDNSIRTRVYTDIQQQLKRQFGVSRYQAIKRCQLDKAIEIIEEYRAPLVLQQDIDFINNQIAI